MLTAEHAAQRLGRIGGTMIGRLLPGNYSTWNTCLKELRAPLSDAPGVSTPALRWGNKYEQRAAGAFWAAYPAYDIVKGKYRTLPPNHPRAEWMDVIGGSPDRELYKGMELAGGAEIKCPYNPKTHEAWVKEGKLPKEHEAQVRFYRWLLGLPAWWFISYEARTDDMWDCCIVEDRKWDGRMEDILSRFIPTYRSGGLFVPKSQASVLELL